MYHLKSVPLYNVNELGVHVQYDPEAQIQNLGPVPIKLHDQSGQEYEVPVGETLVVLLDRQRELIQLFAYAPRGGELKASIRARDRYNEIRTYYACFFRFVSVDAVAAEVKEQVVHEVERLRRIRP